MKKTFVRRTMGKNCTPSQMKQAPRFRNFYLLDIWIEFESTTVLIRHLCSACLRGARVSVDMHYAMRTNDQHYIRNKVLYSLTTDSHWRCPSTTSCIRMRTLLTQSSGQRNSEEPQGILSALTLDRTTVLL